VTHGERDGLCAISSYGLLPLSGSGPVVTVTVEARQTLGAKLPLQIGGTANELPLSPGSSGSAGWPR
jgi:hypothetical protein